MSETPADIVVAGHTCLDIIPCLDGIAVRSGRLFAPGALVNVGPASVATGGAVPNTGVALYRLGLMPRLIGKLGDDPLGQLVLDILRNHHLSLADHMIVAPGEHTSYSLVISPPGVDRTFLHYPGVNDTFAADEVPYDRIAGSRLFHFGYPPLMGRMFCDGGHELAAMLRRVRDRAVAVSLDMSQPDVAAEAGRADWLALLNRVLPHVDIYLPSLDETLLMLDRPAFDRRQKEGRIGGPGSVVDGGLLHRTADRLLAMGAAVVALKLGDQGLYLRTSPDRSRLAVVPGRLGLDSPEWVGREVLAPCFDVRVAGTTGSGDCTIAGFLAALLAGQSPTDAVRSSVAVGAFSVQAPDATSGVPDWDRVQRQLASDWRQRPVSIQLDGWTHDNRTGLWHSPADEGRR
ncbi:MAG: carbohydrate kinase family protein [Phycisphaerae bacterium]|nr:carbohydrate kinase family protein [Phycisphaerae bacterium]